MMILLTWCYGKRLNNQYKSKNIINSHVWKLNKLHKLNKETINILSSILPKRQKSHQLMLNNFSKAKRHLQMLTITNQNINNNHNNKDNNMIKININKPLKDFLIMWYSINLLIYYKLNKMVNKQDKNSPLHILVLNVHWNSEHKGSIIIKVKIKYWTTSHFIVVHVINQPLLF